MKLGHVIWKAGQLAAALAFLLPCFARGEDLPDPAKILGPAACAECHAVVADIWTKTAHHNTFFQMHRRHQAHQIAEHLELFRIKHNDLCAQCHYTTALSSGSPTVIAGVSCESCHGAARDWNMAHSDPADPHRLERAATLGLTRPGNIYGIASKCYSCHTVLNQELVNKGGHPGGSYFELVSWLEGEVRHNVMKSGGRTNEESSLARRRVMLVAGGALDLEYGLRGLASATEEGDYATALISRIQHARKQLQEIQRARPIDQISKILENLEGLQLGINRSAEMLGAALQVAALNQQFIAQQDGADLAGLDPLLPQASSYMGKVQQPATK